MALGPYYDPHPAETPIPDLEVADWDLWLGTAAERPFNIAYLRGRWRGHEGLSASWQLPEWGSHTLDLCQWAADATAPVESIIREHQQEYYAALEASDRSGDSTTFVDFSLSIIREAMEGFISSFIPKPLTAYERLVRAKEHFLGHAFSRKDYRELFKTISTASRGLKQATNSGLVTKSGDKALTLYRFR
ncbi:MAG: hypothetical protein ACNA8L_08805 [Luteolibacter sp.]